MSHRRSIFVCILPLLFWGCGAQQDYACKAVGDREPICGLQAPEDIEVAPGGDHLILSQFGGITGSEAGSLVLFDPQSEKTLPLYPLEDQSPTDTSWGDANCPGAPGKAFSPHGIHLSQRDDGRWQLLAVNHGGRESVEFFEWRPEPAGLLWRGCVTLPEDAFINDVVATPGGGLLVTQMFPKGSVWAVLRSLMGAEKGHVWRWRPEAGIDILPGSVGSFPNGIQISDDGETIFLNLYSNNLVRKLDRASGEHLGEVSVAHPDNSSWLPDGRLLVASHPLDGLPKLCGDVHSGACEARFVLVAINPDTLESETLFDHSGAPMGAGTVAVEWGDSWYIGSYAGDRLLKIPAPALK